MVTSGFHPKTLPEYHRDKFFDICPKSILRATYRGFYTNPKKIADVLAAAVFDHLKRNLFWNILVPRPFIPEIFNLSSLRFIGFPLQFDPFAHFWRAEKYQKMTAFWFKKCLKFIWKCIVSLFFVGSVF